MIVLEKSPSSLICASQLAPVGDRGTEKGRSWAAADSALRYDRLQQSREAFSTEYILLKEYSQEYIKKKKHAPCQHNIALIQLCGGQTAEAHPNLKVHKETLAANFPYGMRDA